ncbi:cyclin-b2-4 [Phtheirospermum japonicum]|uniref:Cyclin-b2-4 n=1 Tax=Phtheirospermum japonicum TaxID=374723 RepID=A0A830CRP5_9LAMI|nr:cyclin-b2-4 [Phtheirospermum japonicum]
MRSDENYPGVLRPSNTQGGLRPGGGKLTAGVGNNRRALSTINKNIIGAPPYPCAVHKRGVLTEKNAAVNKNPGIPVHRPVTRKFAAQLSVKEQQPSLKEVGPSVQQAPYQPVDCIIIDADDYKNNVDDHDVPMFVQHTEAMMEEIDRMDAEIEMEDVDDVEEEAVVDIDSGDRKNPLAVTEYIDDLYAHYKRAESSSCIPPNYMSQQFDINERMRGILIDWLIEVHYKFELMDETLYLTVNLIDRFLAVQSVMRKKLQLVGEKLMINTLQFNMSLPTPYVFMKRYLKAAQSDKRLELLSFFIIELCLVEYEMVRYSPSLLAAAAVFTAQCSLSGFKEWSKTTGSGKLTGVHKKYSTSKYGYTARIKPAVFLVNGI